MQDLPGVEAFVAGPVKYRHAFEIALAVEKAIELVQSRLGTDFPVEIGWLSDDPSIYHETRRAAQDYEAKQGR